MRVIWTVVIGVFLAVGMSACGPDVATAPAPDARSGVAQSLTSLSTDLYEEAASFVTYYPEMKPFLEQMQPGDIIAVGGDNLISTLTGSPWIHVALVDNATSYCGLNGSDCVPVVQLVEAEQRPMRIIVGEGIQASYVLENGDYARRTGVIRTTAVEMMRNYMASNHVQGKPTTFRLLRASSIGNATLEWARSKVGQPYDWAFGTFGPNDLYYCSELVSLAYANTTVDLPYQAGNAGQRDMLKMVVQIVKKAGITDAAQANAVIEQLMNAYFEQATATEGKDAQADRMANTLVREVFPQLPVMRPLVASEQVKVLFTNLVREYVRKSMGLYNRAPERGSDEFNSRVKLFESVVGGGILSEVLMKADGLFDPLPQPNLAGISAPSRDEAAAYCSNVPWYDLPALAALLFGHDACVSFVFGARQFEYDMSYQAAMLAYVAELEVYRLDQIAKFFDRVGPVMELFQRTQEAIAAGAADAAVNQIVSPGGLAEAVPAVGSDLNIPWRDEPPPGVQPPPKSYSVEFYVLGLDTEALRERNDSLVVALNGFQSSVRMDGLATFSNPLVYDTNFTATVVRSPAGYECKVFLNATGGIQHARPGQSWYLDDESYHSVGFECIPQPYTVEGQAFGLESGTTIQLTLESGDGCGLTISENGSFKFGWSWPNGTPYAVFISRNNSSPHQECRITNGVGEIYGDNVTNIVLDCDPPTFALSGTTATIEGNARLRLNNGEQLSIGGTGAIQFRSRLREGTHYEVSVSEQPAHQRCVVANGENIMRNHNVTNIDVRCERAYTIGGFVSGLVGNTLTLSLNGMQETMAVVGYNRRFQFHTELTLGEDYRITQDANRPRQRCTVSEGAGRMDGNVPEVRVSCEPPLYDVGGTVRGLVGRTNVTLSLNDGERIALGNSKFRFDTRLASGKSYRVAISRQPDGQSCEITGGSGTVRADVSSVGVTCRAATYPIGGNVRGLVGSVALSLNGTHRITVLGNGAFRFSKRLNSGDRYAVTVATNPPGQRCDVTAGSGVVRGDVSSVSVTCGRR